MKVKLRQMNESLKEKGFTNRQLAKRFGISHTTINNYFQMHQVLILCILCVPFDYTNLKG